MIVDCHGSYQRANNIVNSNSNYGIYLSDSNNSTIFRNNASGRCARGIHPEYSDGCVVSDNIANSNCNENIYLYRSSNCTLINNSANNSRYDEGIYLYYSSNCKIEKNVANSNDGMKNTVYIFTVPGTTKSITITSSKTINRLMTIKASMIGTRGQ